MVCRGLTGQPRSSRPMRGYPMARLTPLSRERLICRHLDEPHPLQALAADAVMSLSTG
jgi:hypothetical protein